MTADSEESKSGTGLKIGLAAVGLVVILIVAGLVLGVGAGVGFWVLRGRDASVAEVDIPELPDWEEEAPAVAAPEDTEPEPVDTEAEWEPPPPPTTPATGTSRPDDLPAIVPPDLDDPAPATTGSTERPSTVRPFMVRPSTGSAVRPSGEDAATESTIAVRPSGTSVRPPAEGTTGVVPDDTCNDLRALELTASMGKLSPIQWACLEARKVTTGEKPTDRMKVARVMIADAQARCTVLEQSCSDYRRELEYYLTELDRSDADVLYSWLLVLHRADPRTEAACEELIWWADQTLGLRQQWPPGDTFVERTSKTYLIRANAAYARFQIANKAYLASRDPDDLEHEDQVRGEARDFVLEWLEFNRRAGLDATTPWELCMTLARKSEVCGSKTGG